ncbi:MAG TPA: SMP-30/gluconolactonase/LRE family protein [Opitutaceae bacterium]|nr:SMP-30/gluconolactonase/LRE family protein [Opitutaceae bacterium]
MKPSPALILALTAFTMPLGAAEIQADVPVEFARCVAADAKVSKLATDMGFIEGPVWLKDPGRLIFSDIPNDELKQWTATGVVTTFRKPSQNANGNTIDASGRLLTCEHAGRRVSIQDKGGTVTTLVDSFEGKKFNSPNDVVVRADGTVWFTDPEYGLKTNPETKKKEGKEQAGNFVYRHDPKSGKTTAVIRDFVQPNGLAFSPDGKKLYVADSGTPHHIRAFDVAPDGAVSGGGVFCVIDKGGPDGIRVDRDGRVWSSAGDGVQIFAPDGRRIGKILVPESPANLCFGGADGKTLFITARKSLYSIPVLVTGAK